MSDTQKRTVYYSIIDGSVAFFDWVTVISSMGLMVEAINLNQFNNADNTFDPEEPTNMITDLVQIDYHKIATMPPFADGDVQLHGGPIRTKTY